MTGSAEHTKTREKTQLQLWGPVAAMCLFAYIWMQDQVMIPHAATQMINDLNTTVNLLQVAVAVVSLVSASLYLTAGKLGSRYGMRRVFRIGVVLFGLGTLAAVVAPNMAALIGGWSVVRGIASALMFPTGLALLVSHYDGQRRDVAFAAFAIAYPIGILAGPLLMGTAVTYLNWRVPFALDSILVVFMLLLTKTMTETKRYPTGRLDRVSVFFSILGVGGLVLGPILAGQEITNALPVALVVSGIGLIFLLLLLWRTRQLEASGRQPLLRSSLFRNRTFVTGWLTLGLAWIVGGAVLFVMPVFLRLSLGLDALRSAYSLTALSVGIIGGGLASAWLLQRMTARRLMQGAMVIMGVGCVWLLLPMAPDVTASALLLPVGVFGVGLGVVVAQAVNVSLSDVAPDEQGEATALNATGQDICYGLGVAVFGSILIGLGLTVQAMQTALAVMLVVILGGFAVASFIPRRA